MVFEAQHFDELAERGYCIIENYLDPETVQSLRKASQDILVPEVGDTMPPSLFLGNPQLRDALFSDTLRETVADLNDRIGRVLLYPNFTVRKGLVVGWHFDDHMLPQPVDAPGHFPSFLMFNVYLQDNDPLHGGGVDIVPASHLHTREERGQMAKEHAHAPEDTVMGKAGDLVVFDYRVVHRGTHPQVPHDVDRLALQWTFSVNDDVTQDYLKYQRDRLTKKLHPSDYTKHQAKNFFADLPNITRELIENSCGRSIFTDRFQYRALSDIAEQG
ncbi:phytanoyl-CoA dioxygenase family protein [Streptomyces gilvosporeus]|uniref:Phytanoyl-CoA dioxygenase n=1 Tax=Streptomyces gilvosporeus TaxID=553510 RepID=A0A1V0TZN6_9ACTN|nr:phytanoyl-CoA dioxygenase family protein [Streptomyces gilvosporeus]ARF58439.1 hypothetical protein B1H19_33430 [Streptomyces gilvosporeus]